MLSVTLQSVKSGFNNTGSATRMLCVVASASQGVLYKTDKNIDTVYKELMQCHE